MTKPKAVFSCLLLFAALAPACGGGTVDTFVCRYPLATPPAAANTPATCKIDSQMCSSEPWENFCVPFPAQCAADHSCACIWASRGVPPSIDQGVGCSGDATSGITFYTND